ncbi:MAG: PIN domain-containing protein [Sporichthyaceae bacterium]
MSVLDSSALLAFLQGEAGADVVAAALAAGGTCGAANWSEVAQKIRAHGRDWDLARAALLAHGVRVEPVLAADAEWAALRWRPNEGLSLGDRLCLALGERLGAEVLTADGRWGAAPPVRQIR